LRHEWRPKRRQLLAAPSAINQRVVRPNADDAVTSKPVATVFRGFVAKSRHPAHSLNKKFDTTAIHDDVTAACPEGG